MASQTNNETAFQAMKKGWKRAVKFITKPARLLIGKIRNRKSPVDESAEIDQLVQPNDPAEGFRIFNNVENGKLASTDRYIRHVQLSGNYNNCTLIWTDKRFVVVTNFEKIVWEKEW